MRTEEHEYMKNTVEAFNERKLRIDRGEVDENPNDPSYLTKWEHDFMGSIIERFEKYGEGTYISAKQWGVIERIAEKLDVSK